MITLKFAVLVLGGAAMAALIMPSFGADTVLAIVTCLS